MKGGGRSSEVGSVALNVNAAYARVSIATCVHSPVFQHPILYNLLIGAALGVFSWWKGFHKGFDTLVLERSLKPSPMPLPYSRVRYYNHRCSRRHSKTTASSKILHGKPSWELLMHRKREKVRGYTGGRGWGTTGGGCGERVRGEKRDKTMRLTMATASSAFSCTTT